MDAVKDFLLEYYVWVLAVLVILLITVIGFLADTKKKKKVREKASKAQNNEVADNEDVMNDPGVIRSMFFIKDVLASLHSSDSGCEKQHLLVHNRITTLSSGLILEGADLV